MLQGDQSIETQVEALQLERRPEAFLLSNTNDHRKSDIVRPSPLGLLANIFLPSALELAGQPQHGRGQAEGKMDLSADSDSKVTVAVVVTSSPFK